MSEYVDVYLKYAGVYIECQHFGRSGALYSTVSNMLPYGKLKLMEHNDFNSMLIELRNNRDKVKVTLKQLEKTKAEIGSWNNSVEEKMEALADINNDITESEERLEALKEATYFIEFLDAIRYNEEPCEIYMGVEAVPPSKEESEEVGEEEQEDNRLSFDLNI